MCDEFWAYNAEFQSTGSKCALLVGGVQHLKVRSTRGGGGSFRTSPAFSPRGSPGPALAAALPPNLHPVAG